jgi:hypothetical protein
MQQQHQHRYYNFLSNVIEAIKSVLMKPVVLFTAMLLGLASCKKNHDTQRINDLYGSWKLVKVTGGIAGMNITAAQAGREPETIRFNANNTYTKTLIYNTSTGAYRIDRATMPGYKDPIDIVIFNNSGKLQYTISRDTLVMSSYEVSDATADWYVRQ